MSPPLPPSTKNFEKIQCLVNNVNENQLNLPQSQIQPNPPQNIENGNISVENDEVVGEEQQLIVGVNALKAIGIEGINQKNKETIIVFFFFFYI
jgi:hypothetical protein